MKKMLFIYNPRAGKSAIKGNLSGILEELGKMDYEMVVHPTKAEKDALRYVEEQGKRFELIVCCGGDGTLDEVVAGMQRAGLKMPLGYIPAGSTNDFANSLRIPKQMRLAARAIAEGQVFSCDVGKFNEDYFVYVSAFGVFTDVSYKTSQEWKNALGHLAYILEGARSLSNVKSWQMRFESEECSGSGKFLYGMITNSDSVGGFKGLTGKDVTLNDGKFEVTLIKDPGNNLIEWPMMINALLTKEKHSHIISFKTSKVEFFSEEDVPWTRDGEYGGSHQQVMIENIPQALPIIVMEHLEKLTPEVEEIAETNVLKNHETEHTEVMHHEVETHEMEQHEVHYIKAEHHVEEPQLITNLEMLIEYVVKQNPVKALMRQEKKG